MEQGIEEVDEGNELEEMNATLDVVKQGPRVVQKKQQASTESGDAKNKGRAKANLGDVEEMEAVHTELLDQKDREKFAKSDGVMEVTQIKEQDDSK